MRNRKYYERRFADHPDVVTTQQFCEMLGGIAESTARKLFRENRVKRSYIRGSFLIPKLCVIGYIMSNHYQKYRDKLSAQV